MGVFNNINAELARNAMTKEQLVNSLGVCRKTYQNWEAKNDLPFSAFLKCAVIFDISLDELAKEKA